MKSIKTLTVMAAGVLALSALPQAAFGVLSDEMLVIGQDGSRADIAISEGDELLNPNNLWKQDDGIANIAAYGLATALTEPDGTISDIFGVARIAAPNDPLAINGFHYYLAFMSDDNLDVPLALTWFGAIATTLPETAPGIYDARQYVVPAFGGGVVSATFMSDLEVVPEPTTMIAGALLLLPFGASTLRILRKRQTA
jgi:hypothetical protein